MSTNATPLLRLAALVGGAVFFVIGAIQATHGDFGGTHNTIDSTAEYLVTGGLTVSLFLTAPAWRVLGAWAGTPRAAIAAIVPQLVIGSMCVISVINGQDASFFNAVAPVCLLTWLVASVIIARGLRPSPLAYAVAAAVPVTFLLSPLGGPLLTGAFWMAFGAQRLAVARPVTA